MSLDTSLSILRLQRSFTNTHYRHKTTFFHATSCPLSPASVCSPWSLSPPFIWEHTSSSLWVLHLSLSYIRMCGKKQFCEDVRAVGATSSSWQWAVTEPEDTRGPVHARDTFLQSRSFSKQEISLHTLTHNPLSKQLARDLCKAEVMLRKLRLTQFTYKNPNIRREADQISS